MSFAMPSVDTASQAGIYNSKIIACNALALKEKCAALQEEFIACSEKFSHGRRQIDHAKQVMGSMQTTLMRLNDTLEGLNAMQIDSDAQRNVQIAKLREDIASREELLHKLEEQALHTNNEHSDRTTKAIRADEINIAHLQKLDQEIDQTSENLSEVSSKLEKLKELHDKRKLADKDKLLALQLESIDVELQRRHLLSLKHDDVVNLTKLCVTPGECSRLQTEIEELKLRQVNMKQSIEQLIDERDLLRGTANEVIKRIHSLEMEVGKKTGDRVFNCFTCIKPTRHNGHCLPSVLQTARPLTIGQIKRLCDIQYPRYSNNHKVETFDDVPTQDDIHRQIKVNEIQNNTTQDE